MLDNEAGRGSILSAVVMQETAEEICVSGCGLHDDIMMDVRADVAGDIVKCLSDL